MTTRGTSETTLTDTSSEVPRRLSTGIFRPKQTDYLRHSMRPSATKWIIGATAPIAACLIASLSDIRWVFVLLILIFVALPTVTGYIYFTKLLTLEAQKALCAKSVEAVAGSHITVTTYRPDDKTDDKTDDDNNEKDEEATEAPDAIPQPAHTHRAPWKALRSFALRGQCLEFDIEGLGYPLLIPLDALEQPAQLQEFCSSSGNKFCSPI